MNKKITNSPNAPKVATERTQAAKVMGSAKSPAKAASSKANGAKGGRKAGKK